METYDIREFRQRFHDTRLGSHTVENVQVPEIASLSKIAVDRLPRPCSSRENAAVGGLDGREPSDVFVSSSFEKEIMNTKREFRPRKKKNLPMWSD